MAELDLLRKYSVADRKAFDRGHTLRKMGRGQLRVAMFVAF